MIFHRADFIFCDHTAYSDILENLILLKRLLGDGN